MERRTGTGTGTRAGRALRSPLAAALTVVGAVAGLVVGGAEVVPIAALGAGGYGVGAALAAVVGRGGRRGARRGERIDPFTLGEPWRSRVQAALGARRRYDEALRGTREGPLRERLVDIGERIDDGVQACWRIAAQGHALDKGTGSIGAAGVRARLAAAEEDGPDDPRVASLRAQLASADRVAATAADAESRLALLTARLDEAAARAIELSLGAGTDADISGLGSDVDDVVDQLESLRLAIGEVEG